MNKNFFSCSIHNIKLIPPTPNKKNNKFIITSMSPFKSSNMPEYSFTNKKKMKVVPSFVKGFTPNNRYNYNTIFTDIDLDKKKKSNNIFPKISLSSDKIRSNRANNSEKNDYFLSSIYKKLKLSQNIKFIKRENLFFMKEKKSEIQNIHKNLMKRNELFILTKQNNENNELNKNIKVNEEEKNRFNCFSLTEENKASFDNEYNNICKNKLKEKNLIEKEINIFGKGLSWIKNNKIKEEPVKNIIKEKNEEDKKKNIENNESNNGVAINRMKTKDPVLEINQTSNFPIIAGDKKLLSNLWKKDMMKYYKYILESKKPKNKKFLNELLDIYD